MTLEFTERELEAVSVCLAQAINRLGLSLETPTGTAYEKGDGRLDGDGLDRLALAPINVPPHYGNNHYRKGSNEVQSNGRCRAGGGACVRHAGHGVGLPGLRRGGFQPSGL